ncbi:MAG: DUF1178 family protein [Hyphomicrobium sp.]
MIRYRLACRAGHDFEGWFQSSAAFDEQAAAGRVSCPVCGSADVGKAIMAPGLASGVRGVPGTARSEALALMRRLRDEVRAEAEYVGQRFAEEARRVHRETAPPRAIYGEATVENAKSLLEEGIPVYPLSRLPEDRH